MNIIHTLETLTVIASVVTILLVIMNQPSNTDTFGAANTMSQTKRGFEKQIYQMAIGSSVILFVLVLATLVLK